MASRAGAKKTATPVEAGLYWLTEGNLKKVLKSAVAAGIAIRVILPKTWAKACCPILSPDALKLVDITAVPDLDFLVPLTFVVEKGKKRHNWKSIKVTTL